MFGSAPLQKHYMVLFGGGSILPRNPLHRDAADAVNMFGSRALSWLWMDLVGHIMLLRTLSSPRLDSKNCSASGGGSRSS
eukprot:6472206-Amphidinium_carterae.3